MNGLKFDVKALRHLGGKAGRGSRFRVLVNIMGRKKKNRIV